MKAIRCAAYGPPESLRLEEIPSPQLRAGQALVRVRAAGVNFVDALCMQGTYQIKPPLPFIPGMEVAGVVTAVADGVMSVRPGDRVAGMTGIGGGYAEEAAIAADRLVLLPDAMDFATGAGFMLTYCTSLYALENRGHLQTGETLLVLGAAGGVGLAAVDLGKAMGARVIAAASSADKLEKCRAMGAAEIINYETEDLKERVRELTQGAGADVIYDPVGGQYAEPALRASAWKGRYLVVGFANGAIPRMPLNLTLLKGCEIVGVDWGQFSARFAGEAARVLTRLMRLFAEGAITPCVTQTYPLARAGDALRDLLSRRVIGKAVLLLDEGA
jgi:NADPH:quinone reductase